MKKKSFWLLMLSLFTILNGFSKETVKIMLNDCLNITYEEDSYQIYGNNGLFSCYKSAINSANCTAPGSQFSFEIRDALYNFNDHLHVTVSLETEVTFLNIEDADVSKKLLLEKTLINNELTIFGDSSEYFKQNFDIYNSIGAKIKTLYTNIDAIQIFDVSSLENGLYFLALPNFKKKNL